MLEKPLVHAVGFSAWKRSILKTFLSGCRVRFVKGPAAVPNGGTVAIWASGKHRDFPIQNPTVRCLRIEDGFLRSVGLGADLTRPLSWIVDSSGIYYDPTRPSDLEAILQADRFDAETLARAGSLRRVLIDTGLTKYNVGQSAWPGISAAAVGKEVVLVVGQVETDASIRQAAPAVRTNIGLLQEARKMHPRAWLIYKPHPDVVAALRRPGAFETSAHHWCDEVVVDAPIHKLIATVDVVHVMSSLAGFEALLRGKRVICHGLPFYAGWGLTEDRLATPRRSRRLGLDELVSGALIRYPLYVSRESGLPCTVETAVSELLEWRTRRKSGLPWWRQMMRPLLRRD